MPRIAATAATVLLVVRPGFGGWTLDQEFRPHFGDGFRVETLEAVQPDGKIIIDHGLRRLNPDGSIDTTYTPTDDGRSSVWCGPNGQLIGGYPDVDEYRLVWLNDDGTPTPSQVAVTPSIPNHVIFSPTGQVYLVGPFTHIDGVLRTGVVRLTSTGALDPTFDPGSGLGDSGVIACAWVQADGKLLLGGIFTSFAGFERAGIVRLNLNGTVDTNFDPGPAPFATGPSVNGIATDSLGRLIRVDRNEVRRAEADGSNPVLLATSFGELGGDDSVRTIIPLTTGRLMLVGMFSGIGTTKRTYLARLNADGTLDESFQVGRLLDPWSVGATTPKVFLDSAGKIVLGSDTNLLRLDATGAVDPSFSPPEPGLATISAVTVADDGSMVAAGRFTHVDGAVRSSIVRFLPDGTVDPGFDPGPGVNGLILDVVRQTDGAVIVGGQFSTVRGLPRNGLARFGADGTVDPSFDALLNDGTVVRAVAVQDDGAVLFGGTFTTVRGQVRSNLARVLSDSTVDGSFDMTTGVTGTDASVHDIVITESDKILVGGHFDAWNGDRRWSIMRLNPSGTLDTAFDPGSATANYAIHALHEQSDGSVAFVGASDPNLQTSDAIVGVLDAAGGVIRISANNIQRAGTAIVGDPNGGFIAGLEGVSASLEHHSTTGMRDGGLNVELEHGSISDFALDPNGAVTIAGQITDVHGALATGLARFLPVPPEDEPSLLLNLSTRGVVSTGAESLIAGFFVQGTEPQRVVIRGIGWGMEGFGIDEFVPWPEITLRRFGTNAEVTPKATWTTWEGPSLTMNDRLRLAFNRLGAFSLDEFVGFPNPFLGRDRAMIVDLEPGGYTVQMVSTHPYSTDSQDGVGLVEVYSDPGYISDRRLVNISTRGRVDTGDGQMIAGFWIGNHVKRVMIRVVGTGLGMFGLSDLLEDPFLRLVRQSDGQTVATNDNWEDVNGGSEVAAATTELGIFALATGSLEPGLVAELPPGGYTAIVSGVGGTTGLALVEVYELP